MRAGRVGGALVLGVLILGAVACGDDGDDAIEPSTTCESFRGHPADDRAEAVTTLGPEAGWDDASLEAVDEVCAGTGKATLEDVFAAALLGPVTTASALVETYCRQVDIYVDVVEDDAQHLDDIDSVELSDEGAELVNASERLPDLDADQQARVAECTQRADQAALLLAPG
jgi:hypothetical protein